MEFKSKFDLGQTLYYEDVINDKNVLCKDKVEAILVDSTYLGNPRYHYNFGRARWFNEDEVFATEKELNLKKAFKQCF